MFKNLFNNEKINDVNNNEKKNNIKKIENIKEIKEKFEFIKVIDTDYASTYLENMFLIFSEYDCV